MGPKWGIKSFLSTIRDDFSATSQRPIFAKFGHHACITVVTQILDINLRKLSIQGSFAPKTPNFEEVKQVPHSEQATGQGIHCREILFIPRCSPRGQRVSDLRLTFLYDVRLRSYGASKLPNFRILAYFPYTKRLKSTFR